MKIFMTVFFLALFLRELYYLMRSERKRDGVFLIWHTCWIIGMSFFAKYLGIFFDMMGG